MPREFSKFLRKNWKERLFSFYKKYAFTFNYLHDLGRKLKWNPPALSMVGTARASLKKFENEFLLLSGKQKLKNDQIFQFFCEVIPLHW